MLASYYEYGPFERGLNNARILAGVDTFYVGLRNLLGKVILLTLVALLALPLVYAVGIYCYVQRKKMRKHMKDSFCQFSGPSDYGDFKRKVNELSKLKPALVNVTNYDPKKVFVLRFTLTQMQKTSSTLITYEGWLESKLSEYNISRFSNSNKALNFVPEKKLWKKRNKAYVYWM